MAPVSNDQYVTVAVFAGTLIATYFIWTRISKGRNNGNRKLPPSIGCLPIIGSLPYVPDMSIYHKFFMEKAAEGKDIMSFQAGNNYIVVLSSYNAIKEALVKQAIETADRPDRYINVFLNNDSKGIIEGHYTAAFKKFHQLSLTILKEFGFGQRVMEERIRAEEEDLINNLKDLKGNPISPKSLLGSSVLSVISSIVMGDRLKDQQQNDCVAEAAYNFTYVSGKLFPVEFLHFMRHIPPYNSILKQVVSTQDSLLDLAENRAKEYLTENCTDESFISHFIEKSGTDFDMEQLKYTIRDFLLAGFETSTSTLLWALLSLANRPEIQDRLQAELDSVVPRDRLPSLDDKTKLPYVEAFILEVMRHDTLVPTSVPRKALEDVVVDGYTIPKGSIVLPNLYAVHMSKETWGDPENFRPERFLDQTGTEVINKERVIPFSIGKRSCLGELLARQEIFLFITGLLQQFHIRPTEGVDFIDAKEVVAFTSAPESYSIRFLPRN